VDKDEQLLATARDCFHFVTRFFEAIKLSAPHIYHSALELSPHSAIVQKLYHHHRSHPMPRVVSGVPNSWKQPLTIKTNHKFSTWSPCGKSLAVATPNDVEIWDILTLEKRSTLRHTNPSHKLQDTPGQGTFKYLPNGIAYSPDGRSLACYSSSSTAIIIWDIKTGGIVNEIECRAVGPALESLVWSFDGRTIGAVFAGGQGWVVCVCDVASGTVVSPSVFQSSHKPYLWPHDKSLQVLITLSHEPFNFSIYEVGSTFLSIESFSIMLSTHNKPQSISFSPATHRISVITNSHCKQNTLLAFSGQGSRVLLRKVGNFLGDCFSPDGNLLMASGKDVIYVWKCDSDSYTLWREIPFQDSPGNLPQDLQFSPISPSALISREGFLEVVHLDDFEPNPPHQYSRLSTNGTYIVAANVDGDIITITNLSSQVHSWSIKTGFTIQGLALTGNVLLVGRAYGFAAWCLTAEGAVEGVLSDENTYWGQSIWDCHCGQSIRGLESLVTGNTGIIQCPDGRQLCYNTDTGECYKSVPIQALSTPTYRFNLTDHRSFDASSTCCHSFHECNDHLEDNQPTSIPGYKEGWVKYPEGEYPHQFWVPAHWMTYHGDNAFWFDNTTTLCICGREPLVIKF
jgi:WD40 repeat protein